MADSFRPSEVRRLNAMAIVPFYAYMNGLLTPPPLPPGAPPPPPGPVRSRLTHNGLCKIRKLTLPNIRYGNCRAMTMLWLGLAATRIAFFNAFHLFSLPVVPNPTLLVYPPPGTRGNNLAYVAGDWNGPLGAVADDADAITGAVCAGCVDCIKFAFNNGLLPLDGQILFNQNGNSLLYCAIKAHQPTLVRILARFLASRYSLGDHPARITLAPWPLIEDPEQHNSHLEFAAMEGRLELFAPVYARWSSNIILAEPCPGTVVVRTPATTARKFYPRFRYQVCKFVNRPLLKSIERKLRSPLVKFAWHGANDSIALSQYNPLTTRVPPVHGLGWHNAMRITQDIPWVLDTLRWRQDVARPIPYVVPYSYNNSLDLDQNTPLHIAVKEGRLEAVRWLYNLHVPNYIFPNPHIPPDCDLLNAATTPKTPMDLCLNSYHPESCEILPILMDHSAAFVPVAGIVASPTHVNTGRKFDAMIGAATARLSILALKVARGEITEAECRVEETNLHQIYMTKWRIYTRRLPPTWFGSMPHAFRHNALKQMQRFGHRALRCSWMLPAFESPYATRTRRTRDTYEGLQPGLP